MLDEIKYKGKNYTVPTGLSYYSGMFYNKKIFADNGIKIPTTWTELIGGLRQPQGQGHRAAGDRRQGLGRAQHARRRPEPLPRRAQAKEDLAKGLYDGSVKLDEGKQLEVLQQVAEAVLATPSRTSPACPTRR